MKYKTLSKSISLVFLFILGMLFLFSLKGNKPSYVKSNGTVIISNYKNKNENKSKDNIKTRIEIPITHDSNYNMKPLPTPDNNETIKLNPL